MPHNRIRRHVRFIAADNAYGTSETSYDLADAHIRAPN